MPAVSLYRAYFAAAGVLAPGLAARQAAELFLTPLPRTGPSDWGTLAGSATGQPLSFAGRPLDGWRWGEGPRVVLCHPWAGRASQLAGLVEPLVAAGRQVVAFDGPGHGRSPARRTNLMEFATLLAGLTEQVGEVEAMIGHSFGASAIVYALRLGAAPERVALIAPFAHSDGNLARFAQSLRLSERLHQATRARLLDVFRDNLDGWDLTTVAGTLSTPALIVHDTQDREIPYQEGHDLAEAWPGAQLRTTEGLGHRRIARDETVLKDVVEYVTGRA